MCRNHSHLTVKWVENTNTSTGTEVAICVAQRLTLDYPDGRKVTLAAGAVLSVPYSQLVALLQSVRLPTRVPLDSMSPLEKIVYASTATVTENYTDE